MSKRVYLAEDRLVRLFVQYSNLQVSFGMRDLRDKHSPFDSYLVTLNTTQWEEIIALWNQYKTDPDSLPAQAGYLKD